MGYLYRYQHALREYACDECGQPIRVGSRYVRYSLSPNDPKIQNKHWATMRCHGRYPADCPPKET